MKVTPSWDQSHARGFQAIGIVNGAWFKVGL